MDLEELGKRIKEARLAAGMSQKDLADKIGNKVPNVSRMEAGKQNICFDMLAKISEATGKQLDIHFK